MISGFLEEISTFGSNWHDTNISWTYMEATFSEKTRQAVHVTISISVTCLTPVNMYAYN